VSSTPFEMSTDGPFLRLANDNTEIRNALAPLLREARKWDSLPKGWTQDSVKKFWGSLTGKAKHKVTKCIKRMKDKLDGDPGAFCASLADKVDPGWRSRKKKKGSARMQSATEKEFNEAVGNAKWPTPRRMHTKRTYDAFYSDRGTAVAEKHQVLSRGKVQSESYMVNPEYLRGGSMSRHANQVASRWIAKQGGLPGEGKTFETSKMRWRVYSSGIRVWDLTWAGQNGHSVEGFALFGLANVTDTRILNTLKRWVMSLGGQQDYKIAQDEARRVTLMTPRGEGIPGPQVKMEMFQEDGVDVTPPGMAV